MSTLIHFRRGWLARAALGLALSLCALAAEPAGDSQPSREKYEAILQRIEATYTNDTRILADTYTRALAQQQQKFQAAGDLDGVLAVGNEIKRFNTTRTVEATDVVAAPRELADLQRQFTKSSDAKWRKRHEDVLQMARKYDAALAERQSKLTVAGDFEAALAVKAERERAAKDPTVSAAEFELAMLNTEPPAADTPAATESNVPEAVTSEDPLRTPGPPAVAEVAAPAAAVVDGLNVYGPGQKPPAEDAAAKRLTLARTGNSPVSTALGVTASYTAGGEAERSGPNSVYRSERVLDLWSLRLQLRTSPAAGSITTPLVVVQAFIRDAAAQGRIEPIPAALHKVPLAQLTPEPTTIDFPPVKTQMSRVRYGPGASKSNTGQEFYGVIVSVFSRELTLLYQGVSVRGLNEIAPLRVPEPPVEVRREVARPRVDRSPMEARLEALKVSLEEARQRRNETAMAFFANQRDEANRVAREEALREFETLQAEYQTLKAQLEGR